MSDSSQHFIPQDDDAETLWEVIEITAEKNGRYKVRWKGNDPITGKPYAQSWVPKTDCTDDLVAEWKRRKREKASRKSTASTTPRLTKKRKIDEANSAQTSANAGQRVEVRQGEAVPRKMPGRPKKKRKLDSSEDPDMMVLVQKEEDSSEEPEMMVLVPKKKDGSEEPEMKAVVVRKEEEEESGSDAPREHDTLNDVIVVSRGPATSGKLSTRKGKKSSKRAVPSESSPFIRLYSPSRQPVFWDGNGEVPPVLSPASRKKLEIFDREVVVSPPRIARMSVSRPKEPLFMPSSSPSQIPEPIKSVIRVKSPSNSIVPETEVEQSQSQPPPSPKHTTPIPLAPPRTPASRPTLKSRMKPRTPLSRNSSSSMFVLDLDVGLGPSTNGMSDLHPIPQLSPSVFYPHLPSVPELQTSLPESIIEEVSNPPRDEPIEEFDTPLKRPPRATTIVKKRKPTSKEPATSTLSGESDVMKRGLEIAEEVVAKKKRGRKPKRTIEEIASRSRSLSTTHNDNNSVLPAPFPPLEPLPENQEYHEENQEEEEIAEKRRNGAAKQIIATILDRTKPASNHTNHLLPAPSPPPLDSLPESHEIYEEPHDEEEEENAPKRRNGAVKKHVQKIVDPSQSVKPASSHNEAIHGKPVPAPPPLLEGLLLSGEVDVMKRGQEIAEEVAAKKRRVRTAKRSIEEIVHAARRITTRSRSRSAHSDSNRVLPAPLPLPPLEALSESQEIREEQRHDEEEEESAATRRNGTAKEISLAVARSIARFNPLPLSPKLPTPLPPPPLEALSESQEIREEQRHDEEEEESAATRRNGTAKEISAAVARSIAGFSSLPSPKEYLPDESNNDEEIEGDNGKEMDDVSTVPVPPASGPHLSLEDSLTLQDMESAYVDLSGGVQVEEDDVANEEDETDNKNEKTKDPILLRREEEESTQDLLEEMLEHERILEHEQQERLAEDDDGKKDEREVVGLVDGTESQEPDGGADVEMQVVDDFEVRRDDDGEDGGEIQKEEAEVTSEAQRPEEAEDEVVVDVVQELQERNIANLGSESDQVKNLVALLAAERAKNAKLQEQLSIRENEETWSSERTALLAQLDTAHEATSSAQKDSDFFKEQYTLASNFVSTVREENRALELRVKIAEDQAQSGVALVKGTLQHRIKTVEEDARSWRRVGEFLMEKDRRTHTDEIRRRAAEEPEVRRRLEKAVRRLEEFRANHRVFEGAVRQKGEEWQRERDILMKENLRLNVDLGGVKAKLAAALGDQSDEFVYCCHWRIHGEDENSSCREVFPTIAELEQHLFSGGHITLL